MERTALEVTWKDSLTGEETIQFETIQGARVILGGGAGGPDRETPETRYCINVNAKAFVEADNGFTRPISIQLWVTTPQLAEIVKSFFSAMFRSTPRVYRDLLERMLRKRRAVMTSGVYLDKVCGEYGMKPYHKLHGI